MRLWPLSNEIRSKQFLKIFKSNTEEAQAKKTKGTDTGYHSMVQRVYSQLLGTDPDADITVATSKKQVSALLNQLGSSISVCAEPCRRDTFPAIALAAAYLRDEKNVGEDEPVVILPVDPYVEDEYFNCLKQLAKLVSEGVKSSETETFIPKLAVMGIEPTYPSEKYGYILPERTLSSGQSSEGMTWVRDYREKPDKATAARYIAEGALWNGGVFACRLGYLLGKAGELLKDSCGQTEGSDGNLYSQLKEVYETLPKISFDYAVAEKEDNIAVIRYSGEWKDIGTWNTLAEAMEENVIGNAALNDTCENVHVVSDLDVPILCMGLKNMVVSASPDGILVSDKEQSSYIKPYVDKIAQRARYAEKSWGSFRVIDVEDESITIKVTLMAGHQMNYHSHEHRDEVWTVISGEGEVIVNGDRRDVHAGDVIQLPTGVRHTIIARTDIQLIEVQLGSEISVEDKIKYDIQESH